MTENHYQTLGVSPDATTEEITKRFRKLAKERHPDTGGDHAAYIKLQEAYEFLCDPEKRSNLDATLESEAQARAFGDAVRNQRQGTQTSPPPRTQQPPPSPPPPTGAPPASAPAPQPSGPASALSRVDLFFAGVVGGFWGFVGAGIPASIAMAIFRETAIGYIFFFSSFVTCTWSGAKIKIRAERKNKR